MAGMRWLQMRQMSEMGSEYSSCLLLSYLFLIVNLVFVANVEWADMVAQIG